MTYGLNYRRVFEKMAIETLTDSVKEKKGYLHEFTYFSSKIKFNFQKATIYTAYDFFVDRMKIGVAMQSNLNSQFQKNCFSTIDFFQLRSGTKKKKKLFNSILGIKEFKSEIHTVFYF